MPHERRPGCRCESQPQAPQGAAHTQPATECESNMSSIQAAIDEIRKIIRPNGCGTDRWLPGRATHAHQLFWRNFRIQEYDWPVLGGEKGVPLLQVVISELPFRPTWASGIEILQVFVHPQGASVDSLPAFDGDHFRIIEHETIPECSDYTPPEFLKWPRTFPVKWSLRDADAPTWEEVFHYVSDKVLTSAVEQANGFDFDNYDRCYSTKIGGYASYCQSPCQTEGDFAFQVSSEEKPRFMVGDNGSLYFFFGKNGWEMYWDCY